MTQRKAALTPAGDRIQRNSLTRRILVGDEVSGSSGRTPRKRRLDENDEWYKVLELDLLLRRAARDDELHLRREKL